MQAQPAQEEWIKILSNGLITIPKAWREQTGIREKDIVRAKLVDNKIILEPQNQEPELRIFSDKEIQKWLEDDKLPKELADETKEFWSDIP
ncbi:MAG: AbrB/MazE/SpoVT family DNA-binding domain-containing protein [bacterium]|nr:AbrB/MazE/SpoVT family DNA-binding domain-containing protein [bacterium]